MKVKNIVISIICTAVWCFGLLFILERYQMWTDFTFEKLINQNLRSYTDSQRAEIVSRVEDVRTTLRTIAELMSNGMGQGVDASEYKPYLDAVSKNEDIQTESVGYYEFALMREELMSKPDVEMIERLKKGESVVSNIYSGGRNTGLNTFYGIAEPIKVNGEYVGFIRGLANSRTLFDSSQTGIFQEETTSYLIHKNGLDAKKDFIPENQQNIFSELEKICDEPNRVERLRKIIDEEDEEVLKLTADGKTVYITCTKLPYNDLYILNFFKPDEFGKYQEMLESNGKRITVMVVLFIAAMILFGFLVFYGGNKERRYERRRARLLMNFGDTILCIYDIKKDSLDYTANINNLLHIELSDKSSFKKYLAESDFIFHEDIRTMEKILSARPVDAEVQDYELRLKGEDGKYVWCMISVMSLCDKRRTSCQLLMKITDITENKEKELGLMHQAQTDALTGLLNRRAFKESVSKCMEHTGSGYLFLLDLDNFKQINDRHGHTAGDECLTAAAEILKKCFRGQDLLGRYGGDEFFAFVQGNIPGDAISDRANEVIEAIRKIEIADIEELRITCSLGITKCTRGGDFDNMLRKADKAMYKAKNTGKNAWILE